MHIILGFSPISKHFQSLKNVIKAKDPRLALIDVAVVSFLTTIPPQFETQDTQLPAPLVTKLLYSQEPPIPSNDEVKERTREPTQEDPEDLPSTSQHRFFLPKSALAKKKPTSLKEWCSRKKPQTCWRCLQPMLGVLPQQFQWCPDHQLLPSCMRPLVMSLIKKEKEAKGARGPKVLRKEKSVNHTPFVAVPSQGGPKD